MQHEWQSTLMYAYHDLRTRWPGPLVEALEPGQEEEGILMAEIDLGVID